MLLASGVLLSGGWQGHVSIERSDQLNPWGNTDMHKSQLAGFIIDCETDDLESAAEFWSAALGMAVEADPNPEESAYRQLESRPGEVHVEVQQVSHSSRVHLDIETDDIEAEVRRLEKLGARRISHIRRWVVMEAPTGQRFCVVHPQRGNFEPTANSWA